MRYKYRDQLRYCRSLFLHTMQTQSGMSVLSVCVSPHTPPNTDTTLSVYIVGRYSSAYLCGVYGEIQTKHLCGEIKTDIELSEIVAVSISPHTRVECVEKHRNTTLCLYLVECVEKHRQTVQKYNVVSVLGGVCGERLTDNADIRRCVCIWWSVWRNTDKPYRCTTVCLYLVECLEKYRQTSQTCNVVSVFRGVCGERQRDNTEMQCCVCNWWSVWRKTDRQCRHTTLCVYCVEKHRQSVEKHKQSVEKHRQTIQGGVAS